VFSAQKFIIGIHLSAALAIPYFSSSLKCCLKYLQPLPDSNTKQTRFCSINHHHGACWALSYMIEDMKTPNDSRAGQAVSTTLTPPPSQKKSRNTSYDAVDMLDHERQMKGFLDFDPLSYHGNDRMDQETDGVLNSVEEANDQNFGMNGSPDIDDTVNDDGSDSSMIVPIHQRKSHRL
jgi:hypothetical protein